MVGADCWAGEARGRCETIGCPVRCRGVCCVSMLSVETEGMSWSSCGDVVGSARDSLPSTAPSSSVPSSSELVSSTLLSSAGAQFSDSGVSSCCWTTPSSAAACLGDCGCPDCSDSDSPSCWRAASLETAPTGPSGAVVMERVDVVVRMLTVRPGGLNPERDQVSAGLDRKSSVDCEKSSMYLPT